MVCARVDALGAEGETWASDLARCQAYVVEGGADLVWLNSAQTRQRNYDTTWSHRPVQDEARP